MIRPQGSDGERTAGEAETSGRTSHSGSGGQTRRVLIVDDNEDAASSLGALLELQGHQVALSHDGLEALDVAERFQPDVALVDIDLPGIDGYELARRLRARDGTRMALLIALSGYGSSSFRTPTRGSGFDKHLTKPASIEALQALIAGARVADPRTS